MTITELFDGRCKIYHGHVLETLRQLPDNSVHTCITSPPYYGLRAYSTAPQIWDGAENCQHEWRSFVRNGITGGTKSKKVQIKGQENFQIVSDSEQAECSLCGAWRGELGAEPTPEMYIQHLVLIFREVRRVLHPTATLWLNLGDSYAANRSYLVGSTKGGPKHSPAQSVSTNNRVPNGMKPKDLMGIPWMAAFALRADGWWLRSEIIWEKPNVMPSSVTDRPTTSHEHIFLLSKSDCYYYDYTAIKEPAVTATNKVSDESYDADSSESKQDNAGNPTYTGFNARWRRARIESGQIQMRNKRDVWRVNTRPYKGAHFATFNAKLIEPCVLAGTSEKGVCSKCGAPWTRIVKKRSEYNSAIGTTDSTVYTGVAYNSPQSAPRGKKKNFGETTSTTLGWKPSCNCNAEIVPATVLDIFHGSGTTSVVALNHGRNAIGCELNPEYIDLSVARITKECSQLKLAI